MQLAGPCQHQPAFDVVAPQQTAFLAQGRRRSASVASGQGLAVQYMLAFWHAARQRQ